MDIADGNVDIKGGFGCLLACIGVSLVILSLCYGCAYYEKEHNEGIRIKKGLDKDE